MVVTKRPFYPLVKYFYIFVSKFNSKKEKWNNYNLKI